MVQANTALRHVAPAHAAHGKPRPFNPFAYPPPPPRYDIRRLDPEFETQQDAEAERDVRVASLRLTGTKEGRRLAAWLLACAPRARCLLIICPSCMRGARVWSTWRTLELFEGEPDLIAATLIPAGAAFAPGELGSFCPRRFGDALRQQLHRVGIGDRPVFGGIDADYDAHAGLLQPHYHLVAPSDLRPAFEELADRFYAERGELAGSGRPRVYRPTLIDGVKSRPEPVSYTQKGYWPQRSRRIDEDGKERRTRRARLREPLHGEWLLWRAGFGLTDFMFLSGIRRCGGELRLIGRRGA